jgi:hypothetical protein
VVLEERDASAKVLARWVPLGLAVAHAVRCAHDIPRSGSVQEASESVAQSGSSNARVSTQTRRSGTVRKWATTNFDSGEVVAAAGARPSALNHGQGAENDDTPAKRGRNENTVTEAAIPEVD